MILGERVMYEPEKKSPALFMVLYLSKVGH